MDAGGSATHGAVAESESETHPDFHECLMGLVTLYSSCETEVNCDKLFEFKL
jgi:hypothetical protein